MQSTYRNTSVETSVDRVCALQIQSTERIIQLITVHVRASLLALCGLARASDVLTPFSVDKLHCTEQQQQHYSGPSELRIMAITKPPRRLSL